MAVRNGAAFLGHALTSVLEQTFRDFEFIVVDDGSTDETPGILARCRDERLRVVTQRPAGQLAALNRGIELASGEFIARQDADDIWLPGRLAWQVQFLDRHPEVGVVGAQAVIVDSAEHPLAVTRLPTRPTALRWYLLFESPFVHSTVMIRRELLVAAGSYRADDVLGPVADYELWSRLSRVADIANAPFPLGLYREHQAALTKRDAAVFAEKTPLVREANVAAEIGDGAVVTMAVRHARTLRLEEVGRASLDDVGDAVDTLVHLEALFLRKHHRALAGDSLAMSEIRSFVLERLLAASSRAVARPMSPLATKTAGALLQQLRGMIGTPLGIARTGRVGWEILLRLVLGARRYHPRAGRYALRAALGDPINRRASPAATATPR
jgi:hypothetical protein